MGVCPGSVRHRPVLIIFGWLSCNSDESTRREKTNSKTWRRSVFRPSLSWWTYEYFSTRMVGDATVLLCLFLLCEIIKNLRFCSFTQLVSLKNLTYGSIIYSIIIESYILDLYTSWCQNVILTLKFEFSFLKYSWKMKNWFPQNFSKWNVTLHSTAEKIGTDFAP